METVQTELEPAPTSTDKTLFWKQVRRELDEIRQEAAEACALDSEVDPVPDSAYHDAFQLLKFLDYHNVPMPDIGWLIDGGIGFEWRSQHVKGISTVSIYGDKKVIYGTSLGSGQKDKGTCDLTDLDELACFLPVLKR